MGEQVSFAGVDAHSATKSRPSYNLAETSQSAKKFAERRRGSVGEQFQQMISVLAEFPAVAAIHHQPAAGILHLLTLVDGEDLEAGPAFDFGRCAWNEPKGDTIEIQ